MFSLSFFLTVTISAVPTSNFLDTSDGVSEVSRERLQQLFHEIKSLEEIPWFALPGGCEYRAHKAIYSLELQGIYMGKVWAVGELGVYSQIVSGHIKWQHHVAPFVWSNDNGVKTAYVIDPSIDSTAPLTIQSWSEKIKDYPD